MQVSVIFRGREMAHIEEGKRVMQEVVENLADFGKVETSSDPSGAAYCLHHGPQVNEVSAVSVGDWISGRVFRLVHENNLVYNTCWEDPRLDREAMGLSGEDRVLVITSAGCNALDYVLDEPAEVVAVDMNPRQNALLELKLAGIRELHIRRFFPHVR